MYGGNGMEHEALTNISARLIARFPLPTREEVAMVLYLPDWRHGVEVRKNG